MYVACIFILNQTEKDNMWLYKLRVTRRNAMAVPNCYDNNGDLFDLLVSMETWGVH